MRKNPSSCDCTETRTHVPTSEAFEVTQLKHRGESMFPCSADHDQDWQQHPVATFGDHDHGGKNTPCSERILLQTSNNGHGSPSSLYYCVTNIKWSRVTFAPLLPMKPPHHHATKLPPTHPLSFPFLSFHFLLLLASLSLITDPISCTVLGTNINVRFFPYYAVTDCTHWHWHE